MEESQNIPTEIGQSFDYRYGVGFDCEGPIKARKNQHTHCTNCFMPIPTTGANAEGLGTCCDPDAERITGSDYDYAAAHRMDRA